MNIHEHQAKALLKKFGIPVLEGRVAVTVQEALNAIKELQSPLWVVKAQVHAGGRGKAGGVVLCKSESDVKAAATKLLNNILVTHQTGPKGQLVRRLYIETGCNIEKEYYLSITLDRKKGQLSVVASSAGGMDIEEVAATTPEKILTFSIDPAVGYQAYMGRKLAFGLGLREHIKQVSDVLKNLLSAYEHYDASLIEINPLVLTKEKTLLALDAKMSFDDNALYRQKDLEELRDLHEEDPSETQARGHDLSYVKLDGTIGCMVNGAGLAMATMDCIKLYGAEPANFLDVGGGASQEKVEAAFKLILADPNVKAILINIFGGIMRCDVIAQGIIAAARQVCLSVPMVVRLQGTKKEEGSQILAESGLKIQTAQDLNEAAQAVVACAKGA
ncbi:MAG TPA: ADP-forming succinate--CoA ligase subunit beta [Alphaproteobacteria bacterium]|nr:ADP-forming succinate--CoA ligase subunit beta [Alphaproteobacteria bacterium]